MKPFDVSVVIPCFNTRRFVGEAILSVLEQRVPAASIVVVDDGSTDGSIDILESFRPHVTIVRQPNRGLGCARNAGAAQTASQWIAFLDADDCYSPDFLVRVLDGLSSFAGARAAFTDHVDFDAAGPDAQSGFERYIPELSTICDEERGDFLLAGSRAFPTIVERNGCFAPSSLVIHRDLFDGAGGFREDMTGAEDLEFYCRVLYNELLVLVRSPELRKRRHANNMTGSFDRMKAGSDRAMAAAEDFLAAAAPHLLPVIRRKYSHHLFHWAAQYLKRRQWRAAGQHAWRAARKRVPRPPLRAATPNLRQRTEPHLRSRRHTEHRLHSQ